MPSTYSTSLRIELVADNEQSGIWGQTTNRNFTQVFEETITATAEVDVAAGDVTLTAVNGATDQARRPFIRIIGAPVVARQVNVPDVTKLYMVQNTTGQSVTIKPTGQTGVTLLTGQFGYVRCRQGLSAQLVEFLTTVGGNLTVPGTLTVGGATTINNTLAVTGTATFTGVVNITEPNEALNLRSGAAGQWTAITFGRTAIEGYLGISGGSSSIFTGDVAGDIGFRANAGTLRLGISSTAVAYINTAGLGIGIAPTTPLHAILTESTAYSSANMLAATATLITLRNASITNGTYGAIRLEATGAGSNATTAIAAIHVGDGASALAFGTRTNAAGSTVERGRFDNLGNFIVGTTAATYRIQAASTGADLLGMFRDVDVTSSGAAGASLDIGARNGATFTPGARVFGVLENPASTGFLALYTRTASALTEKVRVDSVGRTGFGRVPTTHRLEVSGAGAFGYTTDQAVRLIHNDAYIAFWNTAESVRSGYFQSLSTGVAVWANEVGGAGATSNISVNGATRLSVTGAGIVNFTAGSGSLLLNGAVTRAETNPAFAINASFAFTIPRRPDAVRVALECLTAEAGYVAGQTVEIPPSRVGYTGGYWTYTNAASTVLTVQTFNATLQIPSTGGAATNVTPANWSLRVTAVFL